jgi:hypothetical protein
LHVNRMSRDPQPEILVPENVVLRSQKCSATSFLKVYSDNFICHLPIMSEEFLLPKIPFSG